MRDGFRLRIPHTDTCWLQTGEMPFVTYDGQMYGLNIRGAGRGSQMWHRFRCNNTDCDAVMIVRWDVMARFVSGSHASDDLEARGGTGA